MSRKVYRARFAPIDTRTRILTRDGAIAEEFDRYCFAAAQRSAEGVYVDREHHEWHVGSVRRVYLRDGWWCADFALDHEVIERDVRVGSPISAGFVPIRTRRGVVEIAELKNLSIVERSAYDGAEVVSVLELREPAPALELDDEEAARRLLQARAPVGTIVRTYASKITVV